MYIKHINDEGSSHSAASLRMEAVNLPERWMSSVVKLPLFIPRNHILGFALTYEFSISTIVEVAM